MSLLRKSGPDAHVKTEVAAAAPAEPLLSPAGLAAMRDEHDPDPLVEEATDRLRASLTALDARDEWGRQLAWRQVARIALGPVLTQLRDAQTAARLTTATSEAVSEPAPAPAPVAAELFSVQRQPEDPIDPPFWSE